MADKEWELFCEYRKAHPRVDVQWYFGHTGVGKSWHCLFEFDKDVPMSDKIVLGGDLNQYLKGYSGQPIVILNDIRPESIDFNYLLQLLDPYPMWVKTFGQIAPWMAIKIYITAPTHPLEMFGRKWNAQKKEYEDRGDLVQLTARINHIYKVEGPNRRLHPDSTEPTVFVEYDKIGIPLGNPLRVGSQGEVQREFEQMVDAGVQ